MGIFLIFGGDTSHSVNLNVQTHEVQRTFHTWCSSWFLGARGKRCYVHTLGARYVTVHIFSTLPCQTPFWNLGIAGSLIWACKTEDCLGSNKNVCSQRPSAFFRVRQQGDTMPEQQVWTQSKITGTDLWRKTVLLYWWRCSKSFC